VLVRLPLLVFLALTLVLALLAPLSLPFALLHQCTLVLGVLLCLLFRCSQGVRNASTLYGLFTLPLFLLLLRDLSLPLS
jgi:hypothetical protein